MTTKRLAGRVAIVTGAGRGIGRAIALRYSQEGAAVALAARTPAQINEAAAEIESNGGRALAIQCDVSSESDVDRLVDATVRQFGKIDILANNAAVNLPPTDLTEVDLSVWRNVIDVNLTGAFICTRAVLPHMKRIGSGVVLNLSSVGGRRGAAGRGPYRASKAALINFTETIGAEGANYGVRAVCLCPGGVDTEMMREIGMARGRELMKPEQVADVATYAVSYTNAATQGVRRLAWAILSVTIFILSATSTVMARRLRC